ncbi:MAG: hypothetical protein FWG71_05260 [Synergistaceae bacterium]|nr:hypothetical protein [Synergistaceae bacterium]
MSNPYDQNDKRVIMDFVNYPIIPRSDAVRVAVLELLAAGWARIDGKSIYTSRNTAA